MNGWGLVEIVLAYAVVAIPILAWATWRLRRPFKPLDRRPRLVHAVPAVLMAVVNLGAILTSDGALLILGYVGLVLSITAIILHIGAVQSQAEG